MPSYGQLRGLVPGGAEPISRLFGAVAALDTGTHCWTPASHRTEVCSCPASSQPCALFLDLWFRVLNQDRGLGERRGPAQGLALVVAWVLLFDTRTISGHHCSDWISQRTQSQGLYIKMPSRRHVIYNLMIRLEFPKIHSGCCTENELEGCSKTGGGPMKKLLQEWKVLHTRGKQISGSKW